MLAQILEKMRRSFHDGKTFSYEFRLDSLRSLEKLLRENEKPICDALERDFKKPATETLIAEIAVTLDEVRLAQKKLKSWMKPQKVRTPLTLLPGQSWVQAEPLGVVLIIAPWNYPLQLTLSPLVGALAAGNCAILKPSEVTPHTSDLLGQLIPKYFDPDHVQVVQGGVEVSQDLLSQKNFDHIFFTGSSRVGQIVMKSAAENLIPVTLELGGKSPCVVTAEADVELAARRIVWGKFYNAGQTCVAPDYVLVEESIRDQFLKSFKRQVQEQLGVDPSLSKDYARLVSTSHLKQLESLLKDHQNVWGGIVKANENYLSPTLVLDPPLDSKLMSEEIFGPILPVINFKKWDEALKFVRIRPKPLAAYLFSSSQSQQKDFLLQISAGGICLNDVLLHLGNPYLPFGGVGPSGMGRYHGQWSFLAMSHLKSVMKRNGFLDLSARYSPMNENKVKLLRWLFRL